MSAVITRVYVFSGVAAANRRGAASKIIQFFASGVAAPEDHHCRTRAAGCSGRMKYLGNDLPFSWGMLTGYCHD